ncbi:MAG TPA: glycoside hydrolase N-terminal domain-containing protein [Bacteroidales bacterium]|nr:glycoside hydrolase N-terminal domain-containing protein [Bacteroidales bacterium]
MKTKFLTTIFLLTGSISIALGQVTEGEKILRTVTADTIQGWKKGGVFAVNLAQTSLTNWASGGQNPVATYQALGDLYLDFGSLRGVTNYHRELDIEDAIARVTYSFNQVNFTREIFSSAPDQAIVVRLTADKPGEITFNSWLSRQENKSSIKVADNEIIMSEHVGDGIGVKMYTRMRLITEGGNISSDGDSIRIEKANSVTIYLTAATDYFGADPSVLTKSQMDAVVNQQYTNVKKNHIADYQSLFKRVDLDLGSSDGNFFTTDARITAMQNGYIDADLIELYYQFGRYLLISSSRPGGLPANLQGIWADGLHPPWSADYHININIQMNYWPSEITNLGELQEPFIDFIDALRPNARRTAKEVYGMHGIVAHYTTDPWLFTEPTGAIGYGMWPMGIAWSCQNIWDHYQFGGDIVYLRNKSYPIMKEAAEFCMDCILEIRSQSNITPNFLKLHKKLSIIAFQMEVATRDGAGPG